MGTRSKIIAQKIEAFHQGGSLKQFEQAIYALEKGPYRALHFDTVKNLLKESAAAQAEPLFVELVDNADATPGLPLIARHLEFCSMYMTTNTHDEDTFAPIVERFEMRQYSFLSFIRPLPMTISSGHTEFRYVQRTAKRLEYNDNPFRFAAAFCLPLAAVLQRGMKDGVDFVPCVIPHSRGFFLGVARPRTQEEAQGMQEITIIRSPSTGEVDAGYIDGSVLTFLSAIHINTFISRREFSSGQHALYDLLRPFMEDRKTLEALGYGIDMYSWGPLGLNPKMTNKADMDAWCEVCDRLAVAVRSPEWQQETRMAMGNFMRHERH